MQSAWLSIGLGIARGHLDPVSESTAQTQYVTAEPDFFQRSTRNQSSNGSASDCSAAVSSCVPAHPRACFLAEHNNVTVKSQTGEGLHTRTYCLNLGIFDEIQYADRRS